MNCNSFSSAGDWELQLKQALPLFGHRNWIVVADSAYPAQSNPGIETVSTGAEHLEVLAKVLNAIGDCRHIRPRVYTDQELMLVPEDDAPGVSRFRSELEHLLAGFNSDKRLHEQIIADLDRAGSLFRILILKTTQRIPYTSVFLELDCGYWCSGAETRLRALMNQQNSTSTNNR